MKKKKRKVFKIFIFICIVFIVTTAAALGYLMSLKNNITSSELPAKEVEANKPVNILMLGVDAGDYDNKKGNSPKRTDTMILASFYPKEGKIYMLSIPRDTRVKINGHYEKINAAHAMGGVPLTVKTIEKMLEIEINYYIKIDYEAFKKCIDAIGGVDVVVPFDMNYDAYDIKIHFNKGDKVHLNGEEAEKFVRWRKNNDGSGYAMGDLGRISTQQEFIINVFKKLKTPSGMVKIPKLIDTLSKNVKTNMDSKTMVSYLFKLKNIKESSIEKKILQGEPKYIGGISYFIYDKEKNTNYLSHFRLNNTESSKKKNIKVIILNSTGKNGLASEYKNKLISLGYDVVEIGNYSKKLNTTVINYYNQEVYGNDVYEDIGLGKISAANKNNDKADVVVILGSDAIK
ncbi:transcriptional attenuator, LytR family [Caloramator quimbayensis]|uniref:Transcriptional attenuator, LytR family n=1 Tax=Caloramator quimbayensis TaxID=1147123 RepID=A0A1T4XYL1_9CLOT|nr:LCP family protein [Caloramator quimbayensis]SKA94652.1 transcriptional attenuator, LytR family [Caloramator quimbayensis]